jgi:hypothetical protein
MVGECGSDSGWGPVAGSCEHSNKTSVSINVREFVDCLNLPLISFSRRTLLNRTSYEVC